MSSISASPFYGPKAMVLDSNNLLPMFVGLPVITALAWLVVICSISVAIQAMVEHVGDIGKTADRMCNWRSQYNPSSNPEPKKRGEAYQNLQPENEFKKSYQFKLSKRFSAYGSQASIGLVLFVVLIALGYSVACGIAFPPAGAPSPIDSDSVGVANIFYLVTLILFVIVLIAQTVIFYHIRCADEECEPKNMVLRRLRQSGMAFAVLASLAAIGVACGGLAVNVMQYNGIPVEPLPQDFPRLNTSSALPNV